MGLNGKTPSEACGISVEGKTPAEESGIDLELGQNKWLSLIKKSVY
jgi:hypothetical protein